MCMLLSVQAMFHYCMSFLKLLAFLLGHCWCWLGSGSLNLNHSYSIHLHKRNTYTSFSQNLQCMTQYTDTGLNYIVAALVAQLITKTEFRGLK